jgi:hypothetical protein
LSGCARVSQYVWEDAMAKQQEARRAAAPLTGEAAETRMIAEDLQRDIAVAAYYRAQARGFAPGGALEDWLAAEREVLAARRRSV